MELKMVGSGSYAHVYSYVDPDYGIKFAVKRAKTGLGERDRERFTQEFEVLKKVSFPDVVEVYKYDERTNEYRMEFCDTTLREHISKRNAALSFAARKRIALQFLYGINYLHHQRLLHRASDYPHRRSQHRLAAAGHRARINGVSGKRAPGLTHN